MNTIKPYLAFIALVMLCHTVDAQTFRGESFNPIKGSFNWDGGRFKNQLTYPYQFKANADTGSVAFFNNKFYGKRVVNGVEAWVPFVDSTSAVTSEANDKYQYANNTDVTVQDTSTVLILNEDADNTANRNVTLKSAATFAGKTLKILNYNGGDYFNVLTSGIIGNDGVVFSVLKNQATYNLVSDGNTWRVLSVTENIEPGSGGGGGGNSSGAIVTWD